MRATAQQPQRAPDGAPVHYERHRPKQTTLYRLVQHHAASFIAHTWASTGAGLPRSIKDEFDAFLDCGILRPRCGECGHDKLLALSCKRRGRCPSRRARRMSHTAAHLVDQVIPHVPVRQWVQSLPIALCVLRAAQPELVKHTTASGWSSYAATSRGRRFRTSGCSATPRGRSSSSSRRLGARA